MINIDISIGCMVHPVDHNLISVIGNRDFLVDDVRKCMGNTLVRLENRKGYFNINDFEVYS